MPDPVKSDDAKADPAADINARLAQIIQQNNDATAAAGQYTAQAAELGTRLAAIENALTNLQQPAPTPVAAVPDSDPLAAYFGKPAAPAAPTGVADPNGGRAIQALVAQAVQQAVAPLVERTRKEDEIDALRVKQRANLQAAAKTLPKLLDPASREAQLFDQILDANPALQEMENAPVLVAEMVRGLSVGAKQEEKELAERKRDASATPPRTAQRDPFHGLPDDLGKLKEKKDELQGQAEDGGLDFGGMTDLVRAALTVKATEQTNQGP